jgi:gluconokinase
MNTEVVLSIDLGTSSTRTALFGEDGRRIQATTAQENYEVITSLDGGAELDPGVLLRAVMHCLDQTLQAHRVDPALRARRIVAIGVSCFWHSVVGCDPKGASLTNIMTWADSRGREEAARLRERFDERKMHARTGCMLRASFWPAKLRWLERTHHRKFCAVKQWLSPAEWLQQTLTGEANCGVAMASGTGMFNVNKLTWEADLLKFCEIDASQLRTVSDEPTPVGGRLAQQFPELKDVPWYPGIGDGAASNIGCGAVEPGYAAINVGTSAAVRVLRTGREVQVPFGLFAYRVDAKRYLVGGAISNSGNLRAWCGRELKLPDEATIEAEMTKRQTPEHGLVVLPFWTPERAPTWDEDAPGAIHGIGQRTTSLDLLQALTEASYQRLARIAKQLAGGTQALSKIIVSGGVERSAASLQRLADVLGETIYASEESEATLRGAAVYAWEKLGCEVPSAKVGRALRPRARGVKLYEAEREKQRRLEEALACLGNGDA